MVIDNSKHNSDPVDDTLLRVRASTVTGTSSVLLDVDRGTRVGDLSRAISARLNLPESSTYSLREATRGEYFDDEASIGDMARNGESELELEASPRAHLGA
jgi:hypothetical protein